MLCHELPPCHVTSWRTVSQERGLTFYDMYTLVFMLCCVVLCCCYCCCVWDEVLWSPCWSQICAIVKTSLEFEFCFSFPIAGVTGVYPLLTEGETKVPALKSGKSLSFEGKKLQIACKSLPYLLKSQNTLLLDLILVFIPRVCRQKPGGRLSARWIHVPHDLPRLHLHRDFSGSPRPLFFSGTVSSEKHFHFFPAVQSRI